MPTGVSKAQTAFARALRRKMTIAEEILWRSLRNSLFDGLKFRRQVPIGKYVVDFLCIEHSLIVELDGPPHDREEQRLHDAARDAWLHARGYRVLRFDNDLVIGGGNIPLDRIREAIRTDRGNGESPHPTPLRGATFSRRREKEKPREL
jgi:very-short-patch-repair endonuclease